MGDGWSPNWLKGGARYGLLQLKNNLLFTLDYNWPIILYICINFIYMYVFMYIYIYIYISNIYTYIYIYMKMVIRDPQHTECSHLTEARWVKSICNHEIMKKICPPSYHHSDFVATHASCAQVHELPQSHCGEN